MKINPQELQQIIKEEAMRLKKRMMLEAEKETILKKLQEMDMMGADTEMGGPAADTEVAIKPAVEATIEKRANALMSQLTPDMLQKAASELKTAGMLGASEEQIKNKVEEMLPVNEAMMNEVWDKSKVYNWLVGGGLGATLAGLVTTVLGAMPTMDLSNLADYTGGTVHPGPAVIAGIVTLALGAISTAIGMSGHNAMAADKGKMSPEQAAKIIAARKAREGR